MNLKRAGVGLVLAMFCFCMRAPAEMPRQFYFEDYYGTTNASVVLQLQLYNSITNGTCLYEDSNTVAVVDGFYATLIGDNTVSGSLTNALAGGQTYVRVIIDGVPLSPREPLVPVPYALNAAGVASNTITASMIANGAITTNKLAGDVDARYVNVSGDAMAGDLNMQGSAISNAIFVGDGAGLTNLNPEHVRAWALVNTEEPQYDAMRFDAAGDGWLVANPNNFLSVGLDLIEGNDGLPDYLQIKPKWLSNAVLRTGGTMAGVLDLGRFNMTNALGIYGPTTTNASNLIIMAGSRIEGGGNGGTLYLSGGRNGSSGYGNVEVRAPLLTAEIRGTPDWGPAGGDLLIRGGTGSYSGYTGGVLRLAGGIGQSSAASGYIKFESRVDANGQTISNAVFVGDGSGLTDLPVMGLTTNEADARYVNVSEDTMTGDFTVMGELSVWNGSPGSGPDVLVRRAAGEEDDAFRFYPDVEDDLPASIGPFALWDSEGNIPISRINASVASLLTNYLTATSALSTYVSKSGDTMTGPLVVSASINQTNLTVAGWTKIDYIPPQGGISMGVYTNR